MKNATIIKVERNTNYTVVSNKFLKDPLLSLKAKGLLTMVISQANNPNWDFTVEGLIAIVKEGEVAIRSAIKELKERGYCKVELIRDEKKKIVRGEYVFFEESTESV